MIVTAFYAALLTPVFFALSLQVIRARGRTRTAVGDGGDPGLVRAMRVQANFAEYVPLALILIGLSESLRASHWLLHALGAVLLVGRVSHAYGMSQASETFAFRSVGMMSTFAVLLVAAGTCLVLALRTGGLF